MAGESIECLDCGYQLTGLADHRCPECNRAFDPGDASSVRRIYTPRVRRRRRAGAILQATGWVMAIGSMVGWVCLPAGFLALLVHPDRVIGAMLFVISLVPIASLPLSLCLDDWGRALRTHG